MGCERRVVVRPSVTEVVVEDDRPHTVVEAPVAKVVRTGTTTPVRRVGTTNTAIVVKPENRVVELGIPGPKGPQGPPGPAGGTLIEKEAAQALGGHRIVRSTGADTCDYADNRYFEQGDDVLGLTLGAAAAGGTVFIVNGSEVEEPSWAWTPLEPLYLGTDGLMTQTPPGPEAAFTLVLGFATSATSAMIRTETPIYN